MLHQLREEGLAFLGGNRVATADSESGIGEALDGKGVFAAGKHLREPMLGCERDMGCLGMRKESSFFEDCRQDRTQGIHGEDQ